MEKINSLKELLAWATEINQGVTVSRKCDLQDIYARTAQKDINKFFIQSEIDRKLVICSVRNCITFDEVERLLTVLAQHKLEDILQTEEKRLADGWIKIHRKQVALQEAKKPMYKKLKKCKEEIEDYKGRTLHFRTLYQQEATKYQQAKEDAKKYRAIKGLLA